MNVREEDIDALQQDKNKLVSLLSKIKAGVLCTIRKRINDNSTENEEEDVVLTDDIVKEQNNLVTSLNYLAFGSSMPRLLYHDVFHICMSSTTTKYLTGFQFLFSFLQFKKCWLFHLCHRGITSAVLGTSTTPLLGYPVSNGSSQVPQTGSGDSIWEYYPPPMISIMTENGQMSSTDTFKIAERYIENKYRTIPTLWLLIMIQILSVTFCIIIGIMFIFYVKRTLEGTFRARIFARRVDKVCDVCDLMNDGGYATVNNISSSNDGTVALADDLRLSSDGFYSVVTHSTSLLDPKAQDGSVQLTSPKLDTISTCSSYRDIEQREESRVRHRLLNRRRFSIYSVFFLAIMLFSVIPLAIWWIHVEVGGEDIIGKGALGVISRGFNCLAGEEGIYGCLITPIVNIGISSYHYIYGSSAPTGAPKPVSPTPTAMPSSLVASHVFLYYCAPVILTLAVSVMGKAVEGVCSAEYQRLTNDCIEERVRRVSIHLHNYFNR